MYGPVFKEQNQKFTQNLEQFTIAQQKNLYTTL